MRSSCLITNLVSKRNKHYYKYMLYKLTSYRVVYCVEVILSVTRTR